MSYRADLIAHSEIFRATSRIDSMCQFDWFDIWRGYLENRLLELLDALLLGWALVLLALLCRPAIRPVLDVIPCWSPPIARSPGRHPAAP